MTSKKSILVVDDEKSVIERFIEKLSKGYSVDSAVCVKEAIGKIKERDYDFYVLDREMPIYEGGSTDRNAGILLAEEINKRKGRVNLFYNSSLQVSREEEEQLISLGFITNDTERVYRVEKDPSRLIKYIRKFDHS